MLLYSPSPFVPAWLVQGPRLTATLIVKGTFLLRHGAAAVAAEEGDPVCGETPGYGSDYAPFKPYADVVLNGTCHPPAPTAVCRVGFAVGGWSKCLAVMGDRVWKGGLPGEPALFSSMPITYDRAFRGPGFPPPNIEHPERLVRRSDDRVDPAGFGPIPESWPVRRSKAGTFDRSWEDRRWPWLPEDLDWSCFNVAPADQQLREYLRGDEPIRFEHLHPEIPLFESRLPGLRVRCFLEESGSLRDVPMSLDTLHADLDKQRLHLVWRGRAEVRTLRLSEIERLWVATETLDQRPRSPEEHRQDWMKKLEEEAATPAFAPAPETPIDIDDADPEISKSDAESARYESEIAAAMAEAGIEVPAVAPELPPMAVLQREAERSVPPEVRRIWEDAPAIPEAEPEEDEEAGEEPPAWTRDAVLQAVREGRDLREENLSGLDLSDLDLRGAKMEGARLERANLSRSRLSGADLRAADLSHACLEGTDAGTANLAGADLSFVRGSKAILDRAVLAGADCGGSDFAAASFLEADVTQADFSRGRLEGAVFRGARGRAADFSQSRIEAADFTGAHLAGASFEECRGADITMTDADLTRLHAGDRTDFSRGRFLRVRAPESTWDGAVLDGADFTGASLERADFTEASLRRTVLDRARMMRSQFADAVLAGASIVGSNALQASFERADLTGVDARGSNFYEAEFWGARIEGAAWTNANRKCTHLS